jgi:DNA-binding NarL/FixJ family response regulator
MRVFIADPRASVRRALMLLIELQPGLEVVGEACMWADLLPGLATARPDVVLLEWTLITTRLAEVLESIHVQEPRLYVIVMSGRPEIQAIARAAGADAFVSKGEPPELLLTALRQVQAAQGP